MTAAVLGGCLLLGLVFGGWVLGTQIKETKLSDRYVTVKGLVGRTVKSDSAIWPVTFKETGNGLQQVTVGQIQVTDKQANEYGNNQGGPL
jgi:hypothetical protein